MKSLTDLSDSKQYTYTLLSMKLNSAGINCSPDKVGISSMEYYQFGRCMANINQIR